MFSGINVDRILIYFSLAEEQTSQLLGGGYNVGRLLSGGNVDRMLTHLFTVAEKSFHNLLIMGRVWGGC